MLGCQLLFSIWREQEAAKGIVDAAGVLASAEEPLAGAGKALGKEGGLMVMEVAAGYGCLQPERQQLLMRIGGGSTADDVMEKVRGGIVGVLVDELFHIEAVLMSTNSFRQCKYEDLIKPCR